MSRRISFRPGKDWVWYAPNGFEAYGEPEIKAVVKSLKRGWLTVGEITKKFEDRVAKIFGKKYGLFTNSGSSANLLALKMFHFKKGSEVITPACTFNTTLAPIVQLGLKPVFVDVDLGTFVVNFDSVKKAISKKTVAMLLPYLIGNFFDVEKIYKLCKKHKIILIEDSCDTIGGTIKGKPSGKWSDVTVTSFYASHLITAGGAGGMLMLNDKNLRERARKIRDWGIDVSYHNEKIRKRLSAYKIDGRPYDSAFTYVEQGYNFKPTEMQAAFALEQLKRLKTFSKIRERNFKIISLFLKGYDRYFILPKPFPGAKVKWLAYPLIIKQGAPFKRNQLITYLEDHKIQTRPIFAGNILKHPAYKNISYRKVGNFKNSDFIMKNGLLIAVHHGLTKEKLKYMFGVFEKFLKKYK